MRKNLFLLAIIMMLGTLPLAAQSLQPFYNIGTYNTTASAMEQKVSKLLTDYKYEVLGTYHPGNDQHLTVIAFTNEKLKNLSLQFKDRGALGAVLKAALIESNGQTTLSIQNPEYMFLAYWGQQLNGQEAQLTAVSQDVVKLFSSIGMPEAFGGAVARETLPKYHYKIFMPYFDDPDELATFSSFEAGVKTITANLEAGKGQTQKVYALVFPDKKIAIFGVGLMNSEDGSAHFLPIIGESHVAALPYQIILQGKEATALPGKYRLAIFWPELTMGTFMKIMSTPGDIKKTLEGLTQP
jgi:hypothetical protein